MAQPSKRLSLKVLKAKNENSNWTYAPGAYPCLPDAALKVAGMEVSSCCIVKVLSSQSLAQYEGSSNQGDYEATAFLPKPPFGRLACLDVSFVIADQSRYIEN